MPVADDFDALAAKYGWAQEIRIWMTASSGLNAAKVEDFLYAMASEADAGALVDAAGIKDAGPKLLQTARVRQAWAGLRKAQADADKLKTLGRDDQDLDALLPQQTLDDLAAVFYRRYKMTYPSHVLPSDAVVSRLSKEIDKRALTLRDVFKMKSQSQMQRSVRKKTVLGDGIEALLPEAQDEKETQTLQIYMAKLHSLLLGYAIVGAAAVASPPSIAETKGADTTQYVVAPLDLMMRYYFRARRLADSLPYAGALQVIQRRDESERELWIDNFRNGQATLGQTIKQIYEARDTSWQPEPPGQVQRIPRSLQNMPEKRLRDQDQSGGLGGKGKGKDKDRPTKAAKLSADKLEDKFRSGTPLCRDYQWGKCTKDKCDKGAHLCAMRLRSGRACGGKHPANKCNNGQRVQ